MPENKITGVASKRHQNLLKLSTSITNDYIQSRRIDVSQLRSLVIQISTISFGVVGFSFPLFSSSDIVKTKILFILGLSLITFCAIYGLWYINIVLQKSLIMAQEGWTNNKNEVSKALDIEIFLIKNPDKFDEYKKRLKSLEIKLKKIKLPKIEQDKFLHLLMTLLTLGILLLFLSAFEISVKV